MKIKHTSFLFIGLLVLFVMSITGCSKDEELSKSGSIVFWQTKSNAQALQADGIESLKMYFGGRFVGSQDAGVYFNVSPDCGAQGAVTAEFDLGTSTTKVVAYEVYDQDNLIVYDGTVQITDGVCLALQLD